MVVPERKLILNAGFELHSVGISDGVARQVVELQLERR